MNTNTKILIIIAAFSAGIAGTYTIISASTSQQTNVQDVSGGLHSGAIPGAPYVPVQPAPQTIIKEVQVPGPERVVEKIVEVPGPERIVEKIVEVPGPERVVEKIVEVPGPERIVEKIVVKEVRVPVPSKTPLTPSGFDLATVALLSGIGATSVRIWKMKKQRRA